MWMCKKKFYVHNKKRNNMQRQLCIIVKMLYQYHLIQTMPQTYVYDDNSPSTSGFAVITWVW